MTNLPPLQDKKQTLDIADISDDIEQPVFPKNNYSVEHYFNFHTIDVEKIHQEFLDKDANISEIHQFDGLRGFDIYDPDGNKFGIVE